MKRLAEEAYGVHALYTYEETQEYLQQVETFITYGIDAGEHVILIENERMNTLIRRELQKKLSSEQLQLLHFVNSLQFYRLNGSYHPGHIKEFLEQTLDHYGKQLPQFRVWAHVEWASHETPINLLAQVKEVETFADKKVHHLSYTHICAYDKKRLSTEMMNVLLETHPYILKHDELSLSTVYPLS